MSARRDGGLPPETGDERLDRPIPTGGSWEDRAAFCLVCGGRLEVRECFGQPRRACTTCDYVMFRGPASAAGAVVVRGRQLVLVRRAIRPYRGRWGLPAGFQEYDESPQETAIRETREETGLEIAVRRLLDVRYNVDDPRKRTNVMFFLAEIVGGTLRAGDDADDARFFELDDLPQPLAFSSSAELLAGLRAAYPSGAIL